MAVPGGEGGGVELYCRQYSAGVLHSVSDQIQNLPNFFTTPNKMASKDDIKELVSLKFLRPWSHLRIGGEGGGCQFTFYCWDKLTVSSGSLHEIMGALDYRLKGLSYEIDFKNVDEF